MRSALLSGVRAVFFDAVGTLLHPDPPVGEIYATVGQRFGSRQEPALVARRFWTAFAQQEDQDAQMGWRTNEQRELQRWRAIVTEVLPEVTEEACFLELHAHFARSQAWRCDPVVPALLAALTEQGLYIGLASNFDSRLHDVVKDLPELALIQTVAVSSEIGWRKPAPEFFAALTQQTALQADEILYIGDDPQNDHAGAKAAGLRVLLLDPKGISSLPKTERIACLTDLTELLQEPKNNT